MALKMLAAYYSCGCDAREMFKGMKNKPAMVVELKCGTPAETAIQQIKNRQYIRASEGYAGEILLIGFSYDRENRDKLHSSVIERVSR